MNEKATLEEIQRILGNSSISTDGIEVDGELKKLPKTIALIIDKMKQSNKQISRLEAENLYLKSSRNDLASIQALTGAISGTKKVEWVFEFLVFVSKRIVSFESCAVLMYKQREDDKRELEFVKEINVDKKTKEVIKRCITEDIIGWAIGRKEVTILNSTYTAKEDKEDEPDFIVIPLFSPSTHLGAFIICGKFPGEFLTQQITGMFSFLMLQASVAIENAKVYQKMEDTIEDLGKLFETFKSIASVLNLDELLSLILSLTIKELNMDGGCIFLDVEETLTLKAQQGVDIKKDKAALEICQGLAQETKRQKKLLHVDSNSGKFSEMLRKRKLSEAFSAPLKNNNKFIGTISLLTELKTKDSKEAEKQENILTSLAGHASICIENSLIYKKVEHLSTVDDLTQLYNSRYFFQALEREITHAKRYGTPLSLIFIDLDRFKSINDTYGHLMGSQTLKEIGGIIMETTRIPDIACRYGGDEYTLILPGTNNHGAVNTANRIRKRISSHTFLPAEGINLKVTASFGVATFPSQAKTIKELIEKADKALYKVKEQNGNMVISGEFDEKQNRTANNS